MGGIQRGIVGTWARLAGRLALLLIVVATGVSADARVVASTELSGSRDRGAIVQGKNPVHRAESRWIDAGHGRPSAAPIGSVAMMGGDLMVDRLDDVALLSAMALDATPFAESRPALKAPYETRKTTTRASYGLPLPEPDGWTAVAATVALALFFFLRRLT